jgi:hypothetical protein
VITSNPIHYAVLHSPHILEQIKEETEEKEEKEEEEEEEM